MYPIQLTEEQHRRLDRKYYIVVEVIWFLLSAAVALTVARLSFGNDPVIWAKFWGIALIYVFTPMFAISAMFYLPDRYSPTVFFLLRASGQASGQEIRKPQRWA